MTHTYTGLNTSTCCITTSRGRHISYECLRLILAPRATISVAAYMVARPRATISLRTIEKNIITLCTTFTVETVTENSLILAFANRRKTFAGSSTPGTMLYRMISLEHQVPTLLSPEPWTPRNRPRSPSMPFYLPLRWSCNYRSGARGRFRGYQDYCNRIRKHSSAYS